MLATATTVGQLCAAASTADPPNECPTSRWHSRPESFMNSTARTVSATLCENDPSPQSPSESPKPRLSKRSMPMPSLASDLQIRVAAGLFLPSVKPWAKTPHPRTSRSGRSTRPARAGPVVLGNLTRSATASSFHSPTAPVRASQRPITPGTSTFESATTGLCNDRHPAPRRELHKPTRPTSLTRDVGVCFPVGVGGLALLVFTCRWYQVGDDCARFEAGLVWFGPSDRYRSPRQS